MPMSPQAMCNHIKAAYDNVTDSIAWDKGERAGKMAYVDAFDQALTEYVEENIDITYSWAAALPPPASSSDAVVSFKSELVISDKSIGQPSAIAAWGPLIMACFQKSTIKHPSGFDVKTGTLLIKMLVINPPPGKYPGPLLGICTQIYNWLLTCINPEPLSGKHGAYIGATKGMQIA
jgi:hypothetical protein